MKIFQKITSVFLVVVLLLSSLGFTINKMVCLKSGKTKISFTHVKDCCPVKRSTQPTVKSNCCDLNNTSFNLDTFNASEKSNVPIAHDNVFTIWHNDIVPVTPYNLTPTLSFNDLPPPLYGRQLLSFISILII